MWCRLRWPTPQAAQELCGSSPIMTATSARASGPPSRAKPRWSTRATAMVSRWSVEARSSSRSRAQGGTIFGRGRTVDIMSATATAFGGFPAAPHRLCTSSSLPFRPCPMMTSSTLWTGTVAARQSCGVILASPCQQSQWCIRGAPARCASRPTVVAMETGSAPVSPVPARRVQSTTTATPQQTASSVKLDSTAREMRASRVQQGGPIQILARTARTPAASASPDSTRQSRPLPAASARRARSMVTKTHPRHAQRVQLASTQDAAKPSAVRVRSDRWTATATQPHPAHPACLVSTGHCLWVVQWGLQCVQSCAVAPHSRRCRLVPTIHIAHSCRRHTKLDAVRTRNPSVSEAIQSNLLTWGVCRLQGRVLYGARGMQETQHARGRLMKRPQRTVLGSGHACAPLKNWRLAALLVLDVEEITSYTGHRRFSRAAASSARPVVQTWTLTARLRATTALSASMPPLAPQPARAARVRASSMTTETRPHLAQTPTSACRCVLLAPRTMIAVMRLIVSHAATARTPLAVSSLRLDVSHVTLGWQTAIPIRRHLAFSAQLASTQRQGTLVTALAAQVVASRRQLAAQR